ncbi:hypothetical protein Aros01_05525 [Streptosporangium roseum]|uniref:Uncharacterized protein n=1 Tax=Streptosporangium roseum (strain ATCC 12428 / DSM 43021 / JCM 3005 / KCTC 9067 / NCIMB 10171 / NRRL 2505 / NI 9100) TaxID=479432 RepID=D2B782_STRRD|nr:hypothetical protein Sros_6904 [Streptosporangium roseum DSM 43021]
MSVRPGPAPPRRPLRRRTARDVRAPATLTGMWNTVREAAGRNGRDPDEARAVVRVGPIVAQRIAFTDVMYGFRRWRAAVAVPVHPVLPQWVSICAAPYRVEGQKRSERWVGWPRTRSFVRRHTGSQVKSTARGDRHRPRPQHRHRIPVHHATGRGPESLRGTAGL